MMKDNLHYLDNGDVTVVILVDLSDALDTNDHNILSQRLEPLYGISGTPLNWFRSYLSNRLLPSTTNFHKQHCSTLAFRKALYWDPFYSFCTQKLLLHYFNNTPFPTSLSQMTPSCTIPAVQIK